MDVCLKENPRATERRTVIKRSDKVILVSVKGIIAKIPLRQYMSLLYVLYFLH